MTTDTAFAPFIQLHLLTFYPPANLNRDDQGRPKTAVVGGFERQRVSSQALKRAWRTSDVFGRTLGFETLGKRTARMGEVARNGLMQRGIEEAQALLIAKSLSAVFGKPDAKSKNAAEHAFTSQLAFVAPEEFAALDVMLDAIASDQKLQSELSSFAGEIEDEDSENEETTKKSKKKGLSKKRIKELGEKIFVSTDKAADIAMFGRMLADNPAFNREAAVAVAHAITTHRVVVEDDYYTAVDDLKKSSEDAGAGFIGEAGFASGVFYLYIVIDRRLLLENLGGDHDLARKAIAALVEASATVGPRGKIASYASFARTSYMLAERGHATPRTLASAFVEPVDRIQPRPNNLLAKSIEMLTKTRDSFLHAYPDDVTQSAEMNLPEGKGTLTDIIRFAVEGL